MGSRFDFLKRDVPTLFEKGAQAEVVEDVSVALLKVRQGLELIVKELGVDGRDLFNNINSLSDEGILNEKLTQLFHRTRICANKGVHSEVVVKEADRKFAVDSFLEICIWYGACYKNKEYCLENFNSEDVLIAKKYIFKDDDYQGESLGTVIKVVDPLGVSMGFSFEEDDEVDVLERDVFETEAEYKVRIANLPPVHIGYAILDTRKSDGYTEVQFLQHHIDRNLTVNFTENEVFFFVDNLKPCGIIDGELKAGVKVIDNKVCCDYKRVVLCSENEEVPVNFICWSKIETESKKEFEKRIENLPILPLAVCKPVRKEYDIEKEILPFIVAKFNYSSPIVMNNKMSIHCPKNKARLICEQKLSFYVFGKVGSDLSMLVYHIWNESLGLVYSRDVAAEYYLQKAEQGDIEAQYELGNYYYNGKGVERDYVEAVKWYTKAAEHGHVVSQCKLGDWYYNGEGVAQDYNEAVKWYTEAAEQGDAEGQNRLGWCYWQGFGVAQDYVQAATWFAAAAAQDCVKAQNNLGVCYYDGNGVVQDYDEAVKWFTKAAVQGDATAQDTLGDCFFAGRDYAEAVKWYEKAAKQGYVEAYCNLGDCYYYGNGVENDKSKAVEWYAKAAEQGDKIALYMLAEGCFIDGAVKVAKKAVFWVIKLAEHGNVEAQYSLGNRYYEGKGVKLDYGKAVKWYREAAEQGHVEAQYNLGKCYYEGKGVKLDYDEAVKWYRKAAEQGNAVAQNSLGVCYYEGRGISRNYAKAIKCYRKSIEQGCVEAQYRLAECYYNGNGFRQDFNGAAKLYASAARKGYKEAQCRLAECYHRGEGVERDYVKAKYWYDKVANNM